MVANGLVVAVAGSSGTCAGEDDITMISSKAPTNASTTSTAGSAAPSRAPAAVRRKRSESSSVSSRRSGGRSVGSSGGNHRLPSDDPQQQQQQQQAALAPPMTSPGFLTPEARTRKKRLASGSTSGGLSGPATGGTAVTVDMTPSPLPSLPDVSPVPSAAPLTAPTPGPARPSQKQQQNNRNGFFDSSHRFDNAGASPLHPHRRSRVLFQEHDDEDLGASDEYLNQHQGRIHHDQQQRQQQQHHSGGHHDDRDDGFGGYSSTIGGRRRSLPTIHHLERTHPSLESISSDRAGASAPSPASSPPRHREQNQHYHSTGMPQDVTGGYGHFPTGGRSSPSSHRRRGNSSRQSLRQQQQQRHFSSSTPSLPGGNIGGGARQRGSQSRHDRRRSQSHGNFIQQQQQQQQGQYGGTFDLQQHHNESKTSMMSTDDTHPLTSSSSAERSSSSNESSPERGYPRQLMPHPGHHLVRALSPSAPTALLENHHHINQQQQQHQQHEQEGADQEDSESSPSKDKYSKQQPFSFGTSAPIPLMQPNLGVGAAWDRGQPTHLGPAAPSIMSTRPMSPETSARYGASTAYPNLHRIRIRFRALLSSGLLLASVMFMLILAANYGSITSLDFGYSNPNRAAVPISHPQHDIDYKPVPVAAGGMGLGIHEGSSERGASVQDPLYKEKGDDSSSIVIRRGAGGIRVARNDALTNHPPKKPERQDDDKGKDPLSAKDNADSEEKTKVATDAAAVGMAVIAAAEISSNVNQKRKRGFPKLDSEFYASKNRHPIMHGGYPRLLNINHKVIDEPPPSRDMELYPFEVSDNTQFYPVIDSGDDDRAHRMEMRPPYEDEECEPMADWQTTYNPACNGIHEIDVESGSNEKEGKGLELFGTKGFWRNAWKLDLPAHNYTIADRTDTLVLKTLKYQHNFEDNFEEHDRVDAIAMERLTSSPHVINIYGFCGHSVVTEYADGPRLGTLADKSKKIPLKRLEIARDIASGLADVHGIDGDDQPSFVHLDINPANVVVVGNTLKLNDFNIGIILRKNKKTGKTCGFPAQYPNPQWRSPEESREQNDLTEKVDIFSMGHIFFRLICGHEPWNKLEPGGRPEKEEVLAKVKRGTLPYIPDEVMKTEDREIQLIRDAMLKCYTADANKRPSARAIADELDSALKKMSAEVKAKAKAPVTPTKAKPKPKAPVKTASTKVKPTSTKTEKKPSVSNEAAKATAVKRKVKESDETTKAVSLNEKTDGKKTKETASKKAAREKKATKAKPVTKKKI